MPGNKDLNSAVSLTVKVNRAHPSVKGDQIKNARFAFLFMR